MIHRAENEGNLDEWCGNLKTSGFICKVISLTDRYSPFLHEENNDIPGSSAFVVYPSKDHMYSSETGPFQLVRLSFSPMVLGVCSVLSMNFRMCQKGNVRLSVVKKYFL